MTDICRLCASLKTLDQLVTIEDPALALKKKLTRCCQLEFDDNEDFLPQNVCLVCVQNLENSWNFAENVSQAQQTLRKAFSVDFAKKLIKCEVEDIEQESDKTSGDCKTDQNLQKKRKLAELSLKLQSVITSLHLRDYSNKEIASKLNLQLEAVESWLIEYNSLKNPESSLRLEDAAIKFDHDFNLLTSSQQNDEENFPSNEGSVESFHFGDILPSGEVNELPAEDSQPSEDILRKDEPDSSQSEEDEDSLNECSDEQLMDVVEFTADECMADGSINEKGLQRLPEHQSWKHLLWKCCQCDNHFNDAVELRLHSNSEHQSSVRYFCFDCPKLFNKYSKFIFHVQTKHRPHLMYCCDICSQYYWDLKLLREHIAEHTSNDRPYLCQTCGKGFKNSSILQVHCRSHLPSDLKNQFSCDICCKKFSTKPNLMAHKRIHTGVREYTCDQCGKSFVQKGNLDNHMLTHVSSKPFKCELCTKSFKTALRLMKHKTVHTDIKPHKCDVCNREFREKGTLNEHLRIHTGAMPFSCEFCNKKFRFKGVLTTHRRLHTGERPYSCLECNHHFTNWPNYNKHMKRRHGINTSVTVRKPQTIPPSGMPAKAKQNHVVPTVHNMIFVSSPGVTATPIATDAVDHNVNEANGEIESQNLQVYATTAGDSTGHIMGNDAAIMEAVSSNDGVNLLHSHEASQLTVQIHPQPGIGHEVLQPRQDDLAVANQYTFIPTNQTMLGYYNIQTVDVDLIQQHVQQ